MESKLPEEKSSQLPAEVVEQINNEAAAKTNEVDERLKAGSKDYGRRISHLDGYESGYITGATEYAKKLHELQEELKSANHSLESYKKAFVNKVEWQDNAKEIFAEVFQKHESGLLPDRFIYDKIKKFLYGE